jgi:hypothetical protein
MSNSDPGSPQPLKYSGARFVEVEFPRQLRPRLVIEFAEGLSLLLEDRDAIPIALDPCDMRKSLNSLQQIAADQLQGNPAARDALFVSTNKRRNRIKLHAEALQLLIDGVDMRGAALKPWYERAE